MEQLFFHPVVISADPLCQESNGTARRNAVQMKKLVCILNPFQYVTAAAWQ